MMDNQSSGQSLAQESVGVPAITPPGRKKSRAWVIIVVVVAAACLLCAVVGGLVFGKSIITSITEKDDIAQVCDRFMHAMLDRDVDSAYALFSTRARRQVPITELQALVQDNLYLLFAGYEGLEITDIRVSDRVDANPDVPQGWVAEVDGVIHYDSGPDSTFNAVLEKENDAWMLAGFYITPVPERLGP